MKNTRKLTGILLAVILCISMIPASAMAIGTGAADDGQVIDNANNEQDGSGAQPNTTEPAEPSPGPTGDNVTPAVNPDDASRAREEAAAIESTAPQAVFASPLEGNSTAADVLIKFMDAEGGLITHASYRAIIEAAETELRIKANNFPESLLLPDSGYKVFLNKNATEAYYEGENPLPPKDITHETTYDTDTGVLTLPAAYDGNDISVEWEKIGQVDSLSVKAEVQANFDGGENNFTLPLEKKQADFGMEIPLSQSNIFDESVSVRQGGFEVPAGLYKIVGGTLFVYTPVIAGNLEINVTGRLESDDDVFGAAEEIRITPFGVQFPDDYDNATRGNAYSITSANLGTADVGNAGDPSNGTRYGFDPSTWIGSGNLPSVFFVVNITGVNGINLNFDDTSLGVVDQYGSHNGLGHYWVHARCDDTTGISNRHDEIVFSSGTVWETNYSAGGKDLYYFYINCAYANGSASPIQPIHGYFLAETTGSAKVKKTSSNPDYTNGNPLYSHVGTKFEVYTGQNVKVGEISIKSDGTSTELELPAGNYYAKETAVGKGYDKEQSLKKNSRINFVVKSGAVTTFDAVNIPLNDPMSILLRKIDAVTKKPVPQGGASLENAEFTVKYYTAYHDTAAAAAKDTAARTWVFKTDDTGRIYLADTAKYFVPSKSDPLYKSDGLVVFPIGTYTTTESLAPYGYERDPSVRLQQLRARDDGTAEWFYNELKNPIEEQPKLAGISVEKWDAELDKKQPQGSATLQNFVFNIVNLNDNPVSYNGVEYSKNDVILSITTNEQGIASTSNSVLPVGEYRVEEQTPGTGYLKEGTLQRTFTITESDAGKIKHLGDNLTAIKNQVIRGGFTLAKFDLELDEQTPQGSAQISGAKIEIVNLGENPVLVNNELFAKGKVCFTFETGPDGSYTSAADLLPYSDYLAREIVPPTGYLPEGKLTTEFSIEENGVIVPLNDSATAIKNQVIRGDLEAIKVSDGDHNRMAGVKFRITSMTSGESHVLVTDKNGQFSTASSWNPHSRNTNRGESSEDGIWFGSLDVLDDDRGGLIYDDYLVDEILVEGVNSDRELISFSVAIYKEKTVVNLGTITNDYTKHPEIFTTARDEETQTNEAFAGKGTVIVDTIYYAGLPKLGVDYTSVGFLVDLDTGERVLIDGKEITGEHTFKAFSENGNVSMKFAFDSTSLMGRSIVVYQQLYLGGKLIAEHCQLEDNPDQTITFLEPSLHTTAAGDGEMKFILPHSKATIKDVVAIGNVVPGLSYDLVGTLMDRDTGELIVIDGSEVTEEMVIKPKEAAGSFTMNFKLDAASLAGRTVVVFEKLYYNGQLIAEHCSLDSEEQSVTVLEPGLQTRAASPDGAKDLIICPKTVVNDTIGFDNVLPNLDYDLVGTLMNPETGKPILIDDEEVTVEMEFTPDSGSGEVTMTFEFDSLGLAGQKVVVFERLYYKGTLIAEHCSLDSEEQSVAFISPSIKTNAVAGDGSKVAPVSGTAIVNDTAAYENVPAGETLLLQGVLMEQQSGQPLQKDGMDVCAEVEFVPDSTSGEVVVSFSFDSRAIGGKTLVVFETLIHKDTGTIIAEHADLTDQAQMVGIGVDVPVEETPQPGESKAQTQTGTGARTGRDGLPVWLLAVAIGAGAAAVMIALRRKKKKGAQIKK